MIIQGVTITGASVYDASLVTGNNQLLYLDAGNSSSYSGSGTQWNDISGNGNHATLYNSPTYSSDFGGILTFTDTSNNYADLNNLGNLSVWTIEAWARAKTSLSSKITSIICNEFDLINKLNYIICF